MVLPICSFSRAACRTAAFSFTKHNVRTALNGQYKRTFSSSPPPKVGVEKVVRVIRKGTADGKGAATAETGTQTWLQRFLAHKEIPPRSTFAWYREMLLISTVFGITGTSTMVLVRPAVKDVLGLEGNFKDGPWSYRISSLVIMSPIYSVLLVVVGTIFGRHVYFRHFSVKMLSRFGIPPTMLDKTFHETQKTFRKW